MDGMNVAVLRTSLGSSSNQLTQLNPAGPMLVIDPRAYQFAHFAVRKAMDWLRIKDCDQELLSVESSRTPCREFYHPVLPHAAEEPLQTSGAVESVQHSDVDMQDSDVQKSNSFWHCGWAVYRKDAADIGEDWQDLFAAASSLQAVGAREKAAMAASERALAAAMAAAAKRARETAATAASAKRARETAATVASAK